MASWITTSIAICVLAAVCMGIELGGLHQFSELSLGGGEELLEHHKELLHEEHKPATSYQNFNLESKNPVPVIVKKELLHHEEEPKISLGEESFGGFGEHHFEEPLELKHF